MFRRSQHRLIDHTIDLYFSLCDSVERVMGEASVETVRLEELVAAPEPTLCRLCGSLGVDAPADWLAACAELVWKAPKQTRGDVDWTPEAVALVGERAARFPWLRGYTLTR
jgi:hypothetical protein